MTVLTRNPSPLPAPLSPHLVWLESNACCTLSIMSISHPHSRSTPALPSPPNTLLGVLWFGSSREHQVHQSERGSHPATPSGKSFLRSYRAKLPGHSVFEGLYGSGFTWLGFNIAFDRVWFRAYMVIGLKIYTLLWRERKLYNLALGRQASPKSFLYTLKIPTAIAPSDKQKP